MKKWQVEDLNITVDAILRGQGADRWWIYDHHAGCTSALETEHQDPSG